MMQKFLTLPAAIMFAAFMLFLAALCYAPPGNPATRAVVAFIVALTGGAGYFMRTLFTGNEAQQRDSLRPKPKLDTGDSIAPTTNLIDLRKSEALMGVYEVRKEPKE